MTRLAILITLAALAGNAGAERLGVPSCQLNRANLDTCPAEELESLPCQTIKEFLSVCSAEEQKLPPDPRAHFPTQSLGEFGDLGWYKDLGYDFPSQEEHNQCARPYISGASRGTIDLITFWPPDFSVSTPRVLAEAFNESLKSNGVPKEERQKALWGYAMGWLWSKDSIPTEEDVKRRKYEWLKIMIDFAKEISEE